MPVTDVIALFSTAAADGSPGGYPVTRTAADSFSSSGIVVTGATSSFTIAAVVVPFVPHRDIVLPEGVHVQDVRIIDTTTPLQSNPPDSITIAGEAFSVFEIEGPVHFLGGTRYTAYAARQVVPG